MSMYIPEIKEEVSENAKMLVEDGGKFYRTNMSSGASNPFSKEEIVIYPQTNVINNTQDGVLLTPVFDLIDGEEYIVTIDGTEYKSTAIKIPNGEGGSVTMLGNYKLFMGTGTTEEPFLLVHGSNWDTGEKVIIFSSTVLQDGVELTLEVKWNKITRIDAEFLPKIPTFDLMEMGWEEIREADGVRQILDTDVTEIRKALSQGRTIKFKIRIGGSNFEFYMGTYVYNDYNDTYGGYGSLYAADVPLIIEVGLNRISVTAGYPQPS